MHGSQPSRIGPVKLIPIPDNCLSDKVHPRSAYKYLRKKTRILFLQADELGPLAQTAVAADLAL